MFIRREYPEYMTATPIHAKNLRGVEWSSTASAFSSSAFPLFPENRSMADIAMKKAIAAARGYDTSMPARRPPMKVEKPAPNDQEKLKSETVEESSLPSLP